MVCVCIVNVVLKSRFRHRKYLVMFARKTLRIIFEKTTLFIFKFEKYDWQNFQLSMKDDGKQAQHRRILRIIYFVFFSI